MTKIDKQEFLESLETTKDLTMTLFMMSIEIWQYYELRWEDKKFASKCDKILGFKDRLTQKNFMNEVETNVNALIISLHLLIRNDLFDMLLTDHNINLYEINNRKDMLAARSKVTELMAQGKLTISDGCKILSNLDETRDKIFASNCVGVLYEVIDKKHVYLDLVPSK